MQSDPNESSLSDPAGREAAGRTEGLTFETCYRHPDEPTGVHCTRCGRPICTECMNTAAVGYQCPECLAAASREGPRHRGRIVLGRRRSVTTVLLVANVLMFLVEIAASRGGPSAGGPSLETLRDLGALDPAAIALQHQYWRLITPIFLHAGLLHLALNSYGLYLFGNLVEQAFGRAGFLAIYLVGGFLASVSSFVFGSPYAVGVGASGAIFGLLGAWVAYNYRRRGTAFASANLRWAIMLVGINLLLGFSIAGIDNLAHLGGLVAGGAAGYLMEGFGPRDVRAFISIAGMAALVALGAALTAWRISALT